MYKHKYQHLVIEDILPSTAILLPVDFMLCVFSLICFFLEGKK